MAKGSTTEELLITAIEGGIRAIKGGRKSPADADLGGRFKRLEPLNKGMYDDLLGQYTIAVRDYKDKPAGIPANRAAKKV